MCTTCDKLNKNELHLEFSKCDLSILLKKKKKTGKTEALAAETKYFKKFNAFVFSHLTRQAKVVAASYKNISANKVLFSLMNKKEDTFIDDLNLKDTVFTKQFKQNLEYIYENAATEAISFLDVNAIIDANMVHEAAVEWASSHADDIEQLLDKTTRDIIRLDISNGIKEGLTTAEIAEKIMNSTAFDANRADRIARTEIVTAHVQGNVQIWQKSGLVDKIEWITAHDEMVCLVCALNNAAIRDFGKPFPSGAISSPAHPRCRCDLLPVLK